MEGLSRAGNKELQGLLLLACEPVVDFYTAQEKVLYPIKTGDVFVPGLKYVLFTKKINK